MQDTRFRHEIPGRGGGAGDEGDTGDEGGGAPGRNRTADTTFQLVFGIGSEQVIEFTYGHVLQLVGTKWHFCGGLQEIAHFQKPGLHFAPFRLDSVAENTALRVVGRSDPGGQFGRREKGITPGEAHARGTKVAPLKMLATDSVVVSFYGGILGGFQHRDHLVARGQAIEIIIMAGIAAKRAPVTFEQFDFAVNGKHLLDEGSPEMQEPHGKRTLVVGAER